MFSSLIKLASIAALALMVGFVAQPDAEEAGLTGTPVVAKSGVAQQPAGTAADETSAAAPSDRPSKQRRQRYRDLGYFPPARSKAVGMSSEWRSFADTVDRVCAASFNYAMSLDSQAEAQARQEGWSDERAESVITEIWSQEDRRIDIAVTKMGTPPEKARLLRRWHANVATRANLFHRASVVSRRGDYRAEDRIFDRIDELKAKADRLGQRFGLRVCTSN